jgi:hypothetical protein
MPGCWELMYQLVQLCKDDPNIAHEARHRGKDFIDDEVGEINIMSPISASCSLSHLLYLFVKMRRFSQLLIPALNLCWSSMRCCKHKPPCPPLLKHKPHLLFSHAIDTHFGTKVHKRKSLLS